MIRFLALCAVLLLACGQRQSVPDVTPAPGPADTGLAADPVPVGQRTTGTPRCGMQLTSPAFADGQAIPKQYTGDGRNISPPLAWTDAPEGTKSFALICNDPDAPVGDFIHWVLYNLPPESEGLDPGIPRNDVLKDGSRQGTNGFVLVGYDGPLPPPGRPHRYFFNLYAIDTRLYIDELPEDAVAVRKSMEGHVLATATLMGFYGR